MSELFYANENLKGMKVIRSQNLTDIIDQIQDQKEINVDIALLAEDMLEIQCDNISAKRESGGKGDLDKPQAKSFFLVWIYIQSRCMA